VGRHELHGYFDRTFNDDDNLEEYYGQLPRNNPNNMENLFQIREDPRNPGVYFGIDCPEFQTHAAGQILKINGAPNTPADQMYVSYVTARETSRISDNPGPNHSGLYRNPLPMASGALVAAHTTETRAEANQGTTTNPIPRYQFRIKPLRQQGSVWVPDAMLTPGIPRTVTYWSPDELITYSGNLWELQPVELVSRTRPARRSPQMESPELAVFQEEGVNVSAFKQFLAENSLALIVSRNITSRDHSDVQQPLNIRVAGTNTLKQPFSGKVYDVSHLQLFQADLLRGYGGTGENTGRGRRVIPSKLHTSTWANPTNTDGPQGSVKVASDGSLAAIVPARRALTWQLTGSDGEGVVRERYWLTLQPGEIRVCASCHGVNSRDQLGAGVPTNKPEALRQLLTVFRNNQPQPPSGPDEPYVPDPDSPNPGGGGGSGSSTPAYDFVFSSSKKKASVTGALRSGWRGAIQLDGKNSAAASKQVELRLVVEGSSCPRPISSLTTDGSGDALLVAKVPEAKRNLTLTLKAFYQGSEVRSQDVTLLNGKRKQNTKPFSAKDIQKLCRAFEKF